MNRIALIMCLILLLVAIICIVIAINLQVKSRKFIKENDSLITTKNVLSEENFSLTQKNISLENDNKSLQQEIDELTKSYGGISEHGQLRVEGANLVDEKGAIIQLKGFSSHGLTWYPEYTNYSTLETLREYGANVYRIAMYVEQNKSYSEDGVLSTKLMYQAIENSIAADLYTIVDWHVLRDENPNRHKEEAKAFFEKVARDYANEPGIIYEICNEPNGDTTWDDVREYASEIIPIIRKYSPDAVIIVGTPKYSSDIGSPIDNPLNFDNIMYTFHFYLGITDLKYSERMIEKAVKNHIPVFVTEWGIEDDHDFAKVDAFLDVLDKNNIGWVYWSICNKDESFSLVKNDVSSLKKWDESDLTPSGKYVVNRLYDSNRK